MSKKHPPQIQEHRGEDFTKITFHPDLSRFGMRALDEDILSLMYKRVYDLAGSTDKRCKVYLNGRRLGIQNFGRSLASRYSDIEVRYGFWWSSCASCAGDLLLPRLLPGSQ